MPTFEPLSCLPFMPPHSLASISGRGQREVSHLSVSLGTHLLRHKQRELAGGGCGPHTRRRWSRELGRKSALLLESRLWPHMETECGAEFCTGHRA